MGLQLRGETVNFYGNDGVCIFKFLVRTTDPQWVFSSSVLLINCFCFIFIAISYILIGYRTNRSGRNAGRTDGNNRELQTKIFAIIVTDFFCWIPLGIVAFLHLVEKIDATSWYPFFSILILPINSVINPFLYESNFYMGLARSVISFLAGSVRRTWLFCLTLHNAAPSPPALPVQAVPPATPIELEEVDKAETKL